MRTVFVLGVISAMIAGTACAQGVRVQALASREVAVGLDSGALGNPTGQWAQVYAKDVFADGAGWVRVDLSGTVIGDALSANGSFVVVRSLLDNAEQRLTAEDLRRGLGRSAYFNGPIVRVEVWAAPGSTGHRVRIASLTAGTDPLPELNDLCGADSRTASSDARMGRLLANAQVCTAFMINDTNSFFLTAGHCGSLVGGVVQFNVPLSTTTGAIVHPPPQDQYTVDSASVQRSTSGVSNDWSYFGVWANTQTGLVPIQRYGARFELATTLPAPQGRTARVTGYGRVTAPADLRLNSVQTTDAGALTMVQGDVIKYLTDTTGGNSGSPVIDEGTGRVLGIHYLAGCNTGGNQGTGILNANLRAALNNPLGVARSGRGQVAGDLFAIGDANNNFGTVNTVPNGFARVAQFGARWRSLTWDFHDAVFYGLDGWSRVYVISDDGTEHLRGTLPDAAGVTALAANPTGRLLYAYASATGQLFQIDTRQDGAPLALVPIGSPQGGNVVGIDYDPVRQVLWGLERISGNTRLVKIDRVSGTRGVVGLVGTAFSGLWDLAANTADGKLYSINPGNNNLVAIDPVSGAGASVGSLGGVFGSSYGLAYKGGEIYCPADFNRDGQFDQEDLGAFITAFISEPPDSSADFNGDGEVNQEDLSGFITAFVMGCEGPTRSDDVPGGGEPDTSVGSGG